MYHEMTTEQVGVMHDIRGVLGATNNNGQTTIDKRQSRNDKTRER